MNASVVKLLTTTMWTALVTKQTKMAMQRFVIVLLRVVPSLSEMGPA
jgi:hypothetical protein